MEGEKQTKWIFIAIFMACHTDSLLSFLWSGELLPSASLDFLNQHNFENTVNYIMYQV